MPTSKGLLQAGERVLWNDINYFVIERLGNDEFYSIRLQPETQGAVILISSVAYYLRNGDLKLVPGYIPVTKKQSRRGIHYYYIKWCETTRLSEGMTPILAAKHAFGMATDTMLYKDCGTRATDVNRVVTSKDWEKMPCTSY